MKILRRNDDFKKMPERSLEDYAVISNMVKQGWNYCSKSVYKDFHGIVKSEVDSDVAVKEKKEKKVKEVKVQNKPEHKKIERKSDKKVAKKKK